MAGSKAGAAKRKQREINELGLEGYSLKKAELGKKGADSRWSEKGNGLQIKQPTLLKRIGKTINVRG